MNKNIYRGKRHNTGEWIEGGFARDREQSPNIVQFRPNADGVRLIDIIQVIPETVGQCSTVRDTNNTLMWEGDIVKGLFRHGLPINGVVSFKDGAFGLKTKHGPGYRFTPFTSMCNVLYEVIGNIHDNPELWEGGEQE